MDNLIRAFSKGVGIATRKQELRKKKNMTRAFQKRRGMQIRIMLEREENGLTVQRSTLLSHMQDYLIIEEELAEHEGNNERETGAGRA